MGLRRVLVSMPINEEYRRQFQEALPGTELVFARVESLDAEQLARFDGMVGNPTLDQLSNMGNLKMLQLISSGVSRDYLKLKDQKPGLVLCSATGAYNQAVSEHMVAALLCLVKRLHVYRDGMKEGSWKSHGTVRTPRGMKVLVLGAGGIGTAFARQMKALGSETIGLKRTLAGGAEGFDAVYTLDSLDELLPQADVVACFLPETPETIGLMDERRFSLMKEGSYFLNAGRGSVVDQDALVTALASGRLAGASADVTEPEPLPKEHPLWQQQNMLLTPHVSGFYHMKQTHDNVVAIACSNLAAWPEGPFISRTDYETGYRKKES